MAPDVVSLFHRLNNQLGVILANSELLETKLTDESHKVRAAQVVTGALEAIGIVQHLKHAVLAAPQPTVIDVKPTLLQVPPII